MSKTNPTGSRSTTSKEWMVNIHLSPSWLADMFIKTKEHSKSTINPHVGIMFIRSPIFHESIHFSGGGMYHLAIFGVDIFEDRPPPMDRHQESEAQATAAEVAAELLLLEEASGGRGNLGRICRAWESLGIFDEWPRILTRSTLW